MKFLNQNLLSNEYLLFIVNFHWYVFIPGILLYFFSIGIFILDEFIWFLIGTYIMGLAIISLLIPIIVNITKELVITSKHVIFKTGLISKSTIKLNYQKIEGFSVNQNMFGHILGFGTLIFNIQGGKKTIISGICKPLEFEEEIRKLIDAS